MPIVTQLKRAETDLELSCVFPKCSCLATPFFQSSSSAAVSGHDCQASGHLLHGIKSEEWRFAEGRRKRAAVEIDSEGHTIPLSRPPASLQNRKDGVCVCVFWMGSLGAGSAGKYVARASVGWVPSADFLVYLASFPFPLLYRTRYSAGYFSSQKVFSV